MVASKARTGWNFPGHDRGHTPLRRAKWGVVTAAALLAWTAGSRLEAFVAGRAPASHSAASARQGASSVTRRVQEGSFLDRGIEAGQEYEGTVHTIQQNGMFVVLPEFQEYTRGFLHISQYPGFVQDMRQVAMEGQSVRVRVRNVQPQRLEFTMQRKGWGEKVERKPIDAFEVGQKVTGRVLGKKKFGVFVSIDWDQGGGLLHRNKFGESDFNTIQVGDDVSATIIEVDKEKSQIALSQLDELDKPLQQIQMASLRPDMELGGIVRDITRVGVYVDVGAEMDGLLHARHINGGAAGDLERLFKHGDRVRVQVDRINDRGKLDLRMDQPPERQEDVDAFVDYQHQWVDGIVYDVFNWRLFAEIPHPKKECPPVLALLDNIDAPDRKDVRPGDPIRARIAKVDVEQKTIKLSLVPNFNQTDEAIPRPYTEIMASKGMESEWARSNQDDNWRRARD